MDFETEITRDAPRLKRIFKQKLKPRDHLP
jgi:hypothetical protein